MFCCNIACIEGTFTRLSRLNVLNPKHSFEITTSYKFFKLILYLISCNINMYDQNQCIFFQIDKNEAGINITAQNRSQIFQLSKKYFIARYFQRFTFVKRVFQGKSKISNICHRFIFGLSSVISVYRYLKKE